MAYPFTRDMPRRDRRGELFAWMHSDFLAVSLDQLTKIIRLFGIVLFYLFIRDCIVLQRYHAERLCHGLQPGESTILFLIRFLLDR